MKIIAITKYLFTLIGLAMLIGAFFAFTSTRDFLDTAVETQGTVIELIRERSSDSTTYRPVVEFKTKQGQVIEFASSSSSNPPSYSSGEAVTVLYQPLFPEQAKIKGFFSLWGAVMILSIMGSVFFFIGFTVIRLGMKKVKQIEHLKSHGVPVKAKFLAVEINGTFKVDGRSPYQISAQWQDPNTSKVHVFTSENLWFDPTLHITQDEITVLIERDNPEKYYMDTSFLPEIS